jgi:predicted CoA-binding protein
MNRTDLGDELCNSRIVSIHLLTKDEEKKIKNILDIDESIDMVMTFKELEKEE